MITYETAKELLQSARNPSKGKPIYGLPHTRVVLSRGTIENPSIISVRYYNTNIVNIFPDNTYLAKTANWTTRTTKKRINTLTPLSVKQVKGTWYHNGKKFYDGIMVNSNGQVVEDNSVL